MDDEDLIALSARACEARHALADLLAADGRDACDIPDFAALADSHLVALQALALLRAMDARGLLAKARAIDPRDAAMRADGAVTVALSLAVDVVCVLGDGDDGRYGHSSTEIARR